MNNKINKRAESTPKNALIKFGSLDISELLVSNTPQYKTYQSALQEKEKSKKNYLLVIGDKKGESWASLFKANQVNNAAEKIRRPREDKKPQPIVTKTGNKAEKLTEFIKAYQPDFTSKLLAPRGLVNRGNMCFMNSILQPLLHCTPLYNLLMSVDTLIPHDFSKKYNLMDAIITFFKEFKIDDEFLSPQETNSSSSTNINLVYTTSDSPIIPEYIYESMHEDSRKFSDVKGRQEDAEEFLNFVLDCLHEELIKNISTKTEGEEWFEVGPKNKVSIARNLESIETPISRIFGGSIRSVVKRTGSKDSITIEPFHSLPLDITPNEVKTVSDALKNMSKPELLDESSISKATKQILIDKLPPVLVLHFKRFLYSEGRIVKQLKHISIEEELSIPQEVLARDHKHTYQLFAVVYHHGKSATDGHYTCDVRRSNGQWLKFDDTLVTALRFIEFDHIGPDQSEYLLFYQIIKQ